jgi:hypothetical protein
LNILPAPDDRDLTNYNDAAASFDDVCALITAAHAIAQAELDPPSPRIKSGARRGKPAPCFINMWFFPASNGQDEAE